MKLIKDRYAELINLAQLFLLREYSLKEVKMVDPALLDYFHKQTKAQPVISSTKPLISPKSSTTAPSSSPSTPSIPFTPPNSAMKKVEKVEELSKVDNGNNSEIIKSVAPSGVNDGQVNDGQMNDEQGPRARRSEPERALDEVKPIAEKPAIGLTSSTCHFGARPRDREPCEESIALAMDDEQDPRARRSEPERALDEVKPIAGKPSKGRNFSLEPLTAISPQHSPEGWKFYQSLFPDWSLSEAIPNDKIALKNKNAWMKIQEATPVIILSFHDNEQQLTFLKNIAQAISLRLSSAQVISASQIEKENGWENLLNSPQLRLVIAGDYELYLHPKLMHVYREIPQHGRHFLGKIPLLLLSDLSLYLKEPQLKPLLWRAICNEFATAQPPIL